MYTLSRIRDILARGGAWAQLHLHPGVSGFKLSEKIQGLEFNLLAIPAAKSRRICQVFILQGFRNSGTSLASIGGWNLRNTGDLGENPRSPISVQ